MNWTTLTKAYDTLGESPFWHPTEQRLYWVDILGRQIHRLHLASNVQESWQMPQEACCIAPAQTNGKPSGLVIALRDGFYRGTVWGEAVTPIATVGTGHFDFDTRTHRFNDGKCDSQGRFWCGTMNEPRTANDGVLYSLEMQGGQAVVTRQATGMTVSNGLAWSKDDRTMYWSDSFGHTLHGFDWNAKTNVLANRRVLKDFPPKSKEKGTGPVYGGRPDGATVDSEGNYYVCLMEAGAILKLSPTHQALARIPLPVKFATMPCFGGADLKTLFITSLRENRSAQELTEEPDLGHVFATRVDVAGAPVNFFND
ncbi:MAG: SMP-30/gluconolactonase/LRE family protein [Cytophagales bacterium]|nr:SMP-30/gluconolactonase/LRE family protein [Cytophagales bacterium]